MELEVVYLETYKRGNYLVAKADSRNAIKLIECGWSQITKDQHDNPQRDHTRLDLTVEGQKARIL